MIETIKEQKNGWLVNGKTFYTDHPDAAGYAQIQEAIASGVVVEPEFTGEELLTKAKSEKMAQIKKEKYAKINEGIEAGGVEFYGGRQAGFDIGSAYMSAVIINGGAANGEVTWKTKSDGIQVVTYNTLLVVANAIEINIKEALATEETRIKYLEQAETIEEVEII